MLKFISNFLIRRSWIDVRKKLPAVYGEYLIASSTGYVTSLGYGMVGWTDDDDPFDNGIYWNKFVTHWQPLPQHPNQN